LGDLFSAFTIYFDKPFEEGDFIIVGNDMGVIKQIGIKSTRIEALGGQELVMSNSELTSTRINNYKKMNKRRVVFSFGVEYKTKVEQLKKIKKIVTKIIEKESHATLDRVHFKEFADSSLNFEVVYYVDSSDYNIYMDTQEKINIEIKKQVEGMGVDFAFPSRTVYIKK
jgi:small-conductance mechanosensitive channel